MSDYTYTSTGVEEVMIHTVPFGGRYQDHLIGVECQGGHYKLWEKK